MDDGAIAYVDESMRKYDGDFSYYLCAAIDRGIDERDIAALRSLLPKGARKLHWREMGVALQRESLGIVSSLDIEAIIISWRPTNKRKQERARRKCLEMLLPWLCSAGVNSVVMESRNDAQNKNDREMVVRLIQKGWLGDVTMKHTNGSDEPRLWIPDQILGAQGHVDSKGRPHEEWKHDWNHLVKHIERFNIAA